MNKKLIILSIGMILFLAGFVFFVSAESGETFIEFEIASVRPSCQFSIDETTAFWVWWESEIIKEEVTDGAGNCYKKGGWPSEGCCPGELQCLVYEAPYICLGDAPMFCSDYNEKDYGTKENAKKFCKAFNINTAIRSVVKRTEIEDICSGFYSEPVDIIGKTNCIQFTHNCRCYWDGIVEKCKSASTGSIFCDEDTEPSSGNCTFSTVEKIDNCTETNLVTYAWDAFWSDGGSEPGIGGWPSWCIGGSKEFVCAVAKLSFFNLMNVIAVILILIVIYYVKSSHA